MEVVKLFVILLCAMSIQGYRSWYCDICVNHTLCKYPVGGPTAVCRGFDKEATLSDSDIEDILNRVNARRNLVALGHLKKFPQAANMRKVQWSTELASFAQRWADQCDSSVRPNNEDDCRDLMGMQVGQNIAAVVGPAPGLYVKSFVDMWFMLKLQYVGSIVYYNQLRDYKTRYFTQLIWADTEYVGCGRIKFFNQEINTVVERVVCNFAPKGNNHGKPVYTLGYPATQCPKLMAPDLEYSGLCKRDSETATEIVPGSSESSLLRILDSSNSSARPDLDPNNLNVISSNRTKINLQRNQKTRHAYLNGSNGGIKRDSFHMQTPLNPLDDQANFKSHQFSPERGHSRMYHGHLTKVEPIENFQTTQPYPEQAFRRYDMTTPNSLSIQHNHEHANNDRRITNNQNNFLPDGRRIIAKQNDFSPDGRRIIDNQHEYAQTGRQNYKNHVCTRKPKCDDCFPKPCITNQCTRGQTNLCNSCLKPPSCNSCLQPPLPSSPPSQDFCPCKNNCPPSPCDFSTKCSVCSDHKCASSEPTFCPKRRAQSDNAQDTSKNTQFNYYDLFPNIGLRSGEDNQQKQFDNSENEDSLQYKAKEDVKSSQVKGIADNLQTSSQLQDSYDMFYSSGRKRRDFEDQMTFKPFWQVDEYNQKRPSELKSLRYTTLASKRNRKTRWTTTSTKLPTESITIKFDEKIIHNGPRERITEKYLSFEELMRLRKLSTLEALDYEARRLGDEEEILNEDKEILRNPKKTPKPQSKPKATTQKKTTATTKKAAPVTKASTAPTVPATTKAPTTTTKATTAAAKITTITANTPFIRMKQCTRKITCTWTAFMMMTGADGSPLTGVPGGGAQGVIMGIEAGSRTPPGYVEGCTRTSTCTRDFMNRNKMPVSTEETSADESSTPVDEEYCEKRSLDIQRRNLDDTDKILSIEFQEALTDISPSASEINHVTYRGIADTEESYCKNNGCSCNNDNNRFKRNDVSKYEQITQNNCNSLINNKKASNIDDDFFSMLNKMSTSSNFIAHKCACNGKHSILYASFWQILLIIACHGRVTL